MFKIYAVYPEKALLFQGKLCIAIDIIRSSVNLVPIAMLNNIK